MPERYVSRAEIARALHLSERQIYSLIKDRKLVDGKEFPSRVDGKRRTHPEERCFEWYLKYKQDEAVQRAGGRQEPQDLAEAELRKAIAAADLAELKLARLRGELVAVDLVEREWTRTSTRVMGRLMSAPQEYAHRFTEPLTLQQVTERLKEMCAQIAAELQHAADGPVEVEDIEDAA